MTRSKKKVKTCTSKFDHNPSLKDPYFQDDCNNKTEDAETSLRICVQLDVEKNPIKIKLIRQFHIYDLELASIYNTVNGEWNNNFSLTNYLENFCQDDNDNIDTTIEALVSSEIQKFLDNEARFSDTYKLTRTIPEEGNKDKEGIITIQKLDNKKFLIPIKYTIETGKESKSHSLTFSTIYFENTVEFTMSDKNFIQEETKRVLTHVVQRYVRVSQFASTFLEGDKIKSEIKCQDVIDRLKLGLDKKYSIAVTNGKKIDLDCEEAGPLSLPPATNILKYIINCDAETSPNDPELDSLFLTFSLNTKVIYQVDLLDKSFFQMSYFAESFADDVMDTLETTCLLKK